MATKFQFSRMVKSHDYGGYLLAGPHTSSILDSGTIFLESTADSATLILYHPPPQGKDEPIALKTGDQVAVLANGDISIHTHTDDPATHRCLPSTWKNQTPPPKKRGRVTG
jgi:hypothetical protein